jgi:hypothetical protein
MVKKKSINYLQKLIKSTSSYFWKSANSKKGYWLTRFVFLRLLGFVYLFAFLSLAFQVIPLIGDNGLLPADNFLDRVKSSYGSKLDAFIKLPTLFLINDSDPMLLIFAWAGVILSIVLLAGYANSILLSILWFLYMSYIHIGQLWYGYGWEIQLLETGFLAIFLVPLLDLKPFPKTPPPVPIIWLLRWITFRIHLGSGLIKLKGSPCWNDLTCLYFYYETQPIPNTLSRFFHFLPKFIHKLGVLFSHFVQLIAPWFSFWPRTGRHIAGILMLLMQMILVFSGNLSFLNWITIAAIIGLFDDSILRKVLPKFIVKKAEYAEINAKNANYKKYITWAFVLLVSFLSIPVIQNLMSSNQAMNTSFNQLHLVNTYGAFGSIGTVRNELIIEGTAESTITDTTVWKEYEFNGKPGNVAKNGPIIAPYQPRLDWQIWFAAMSNPERDPWVIHLVWKFLNNDEKTLSLIKYNPFAYEPPKIIRVQFYRYEYLPFGSDTVWQRTLLGTWLPPLSKDNPELQNFVRLNGWEVYR